MLVLNLNIDSYGKEISNSCHDNFRKFTFGNNEECLENLCGECCGYLEIESEISFCKRQCGFKKVDLEEPKNISVKEIFKTRETI
jgi:hypothetical protein